MSASPPGRPLLRRIPVGGWVAAIWFATTVLGLRGFSGLPGMPRGLPALPAWSWTLVAAGCLTALAGCRLMGRRPLPALGLFIAASAAVALALSPLQVWQDDVLFLYLLALDVAFGAIVATRPRWSWAVAFVAVQAFLPGYAYLRLLLGLPVTYAYNSRDGRLAGLLLSALMPALVAGPIGFSIRQARQYAQRLRAHAAAQAVTAERLRISRELHDMVAHSVGIITLQAGAAARVLDTQPERAREAMRAVEETGRQTLSGLRRMLGSLRGTEPGQEAPEARLHPVPGLADLDELAAATTAAGVSVNVCWRGPRRILPPEVDLSAYRIIQESLANVVRHADARSCEVSVDFRDAELAIEVTDPGRGGKGGTGTGYGLVGMRERVALLHGFLAAGPHPDGGFQVTARLPAPATAGAG
jgi:signal transduction histidine kinase